MRQRVWVNKGWVGPVIRFAVAGVLLVAAPAARIGGVPDQAGKTLESLRWLSGQWRNEEAGRLSEETWSAPHEGSMIGMWRLVIDGRPRVMELLSLGVEGEDIVLRLRHFDARLVAREEKGAPIALKQVETGEHRAVFQGTGTEGPLTISYRLEGDELVGTVKHGGKDEEAYRMKRVSAGAGGRATR